MDTIAAKDYKRMVESLKEIDSLLPEGARPWEVAQIALEWADYIVHAHIADKKWYRMQEHDKAESFTFFLKNIYGKHQSKPLDEEDH